jgi:shikimate kinase
MGSGKSYFIDNALNKGLFSDFKDLDDVILETKGSGESKLSELINKVGWDQFRLWEEEALDTLLLENENMFISLGGGTLRRKTLETIERNEEAFLVWLDTPFTTCLTRIKSQPELRPLSARSDDELLELYQSRLDDYKRAHLAIKSEQLQDYLDLGVLVKKLQDIRHLGLT